MVTAYLFPLISRLSTWVKFRLLTVHGGEVTPIVTSFPPISSSFFQSSGEENDVSENKSETKGEIPNLSALTSVVGNIADDRRISVLKALRSQTDEEGGKTVDRAILAIRIAKTVKTVLPEVGLI